jgi:hypothetical protein
MPLTYAIESDTRIVAVVVSAPPSVDDYRRLLDTILSDPAYRPGYHFLVDRRAVAVVPDTQRVWAMTPLLDVIARWGGPCRMAVVTDGDATYGMMRMASVLGSDTGVEVGAFRDPDMARDWLTAPAG